MKLYHWIGLGILTLGSVVAEQTAPHDPGHAEHWWSSIPAFHAIYGFIGCVAIIVISKALGKLLLQKKENYYDA